MEPHPEPRSPHDPLAAPDEEALRAAVIHAAQSYFDERRARVDEFVDKWFTARGSLRLHRHALGWDIARAPANIALAPVHAGSRLTAALADLARRRKTAAWLRSRQIMLETAVMREVQRLIMVELLELPQEEGEGASVDDALAAAIAADPEVRRLVGEGRAGARPLQTGLSEYTGTRAAVAEMTTAVATIGAGAAVFKQITPGALTLGPAMAAAMAHSAAVSSFPLGAAAGSFWYGSIAAPPAASGALIAGVTGGMIAAASVFAAFAGVVADPIQRRLGVHRRRLHRLIDALERQFTSGEAAGFAAREHYVARLIDMMDAGAAAARAIRF